jgi:hypothetical protein
MAVPLAVGWLAGRQPLESNSTVALSRRADCVVVGESVTMLHSFRAELG